MSAQAGPALNPVAPAAAGAAPSSSSSASAVGEVTSSGLSKSSPVYTAVSSFRASFRASSIPGDYSEYIHFGLINFCGGLGVALGLWGAGGLGAILASPAAMAIVMFGFAMCNYFEYSAHRYKLHNPLVHTRHSHTHHRFFTDKVMEFDSFRDVHAILFPPKAPLFLMGLVLPILGAVPWLLFGQRVACAFVATLALYYLSYEWLHLSYHAPPESILGSIPGVAYLRRHHQLHHSQALMNKYNYNITWPICDFLFGTTYRGTEASERQKHKLKPPTQPSWQRGEFWLLCSSSSSPRCRLGLHDCTRHLLEFELITFAPGFDKYALVGQPGGDDSGWIRRVDDCCDLRKFRFGGSSRGDPRSTARQPLCRLHFGVCIRHCDAVVALVQPHSAVQTPHGARQCTRAETATAAAARQSTDSERIRRAPSTKSGSGASRTLVATLPHVVAVMCCCDAYVPILRSRFRISSKIAGVSRFEKKVLAVVRIRVAV